MNKTILYISLLAGATLLSCSDDMHDALPVEASVHVSIPSDLNGADVSSAVLSLYNVSNGATTTLDVTGTVISVSILPGFYNVSYYASTVLPNGVEAELKAQALGVEILAGGSPVDLSAFAHVPTDDLIVSELFFTGSLQPSGDQYNGDQYIKLYNNTDHVIYADGITIFESMFLTTQKFNFTPDIMSEAMTVDALYTIPGSGKDYPVLPGEELLIADIAIDHREINPNSFDLSHADFEWYDVTTNPKYTDIDNPAVENLDKWYCYTLTIWQLHNRGFKAYGIARIPVGKDTYLQDYRYTYEYDQVTAAGTFPMSRTAYRLPNEWIVDVVNTSVASSYLWNVCTPALDMWWAHCGTIDGDKTRYFHAVRRAAESIEPDGRVVLRDTNNSSVDFNSYVYPSEIERQGTAVSLDGTPCASLTIDGVMPK